MGIRAARVRDDGSGWRYDARPSIASQLGTHGRSEDSDQGTDDGVPLHASGRSQVARRRGEGDARVARGWAAAERRPAEGVLRADGAGASAANGGEQAA